MPMDRSRYPDTWDEIAREVKDRAGWKCEECGVEHGAYIVRSDEDSSRFVVFDHERDWWRDVSGELIGDLPSEFAVGLTRVVITVHHIGVEKPDGTPGDPNDKMDCRPENLIALCQYHHFLADQANNVAPSRHTRIRKKHEQQSRAGQKELFS